MAFKFLAVFASIAVVSAGYVPAQHVYHGAPAAVIKTLAAAPVAHYATHSILTKDDNDFDPHPQYKYNYDVHDGISGDSKSQVEERDGDAVRGKYSLIDADGFKRTVHYTADGVHGFNAIVHREPLVKTVAAVKTVTGAPGHYAVPAHYAAPHVGKTVASAYTTYSHPAALVAYH